YETVHVKGHEYHEKFLNRRLLDEDMNLFFLRLHTCRIHLGLFLDHPSARRASIWPHLALRLDKFLQKKQDLLQDFPLKAFELLSSNFEQNQVYSCAILIV